MNRIVLCSLAGFLAVLAIGCTSVVHKDMARNESVQYLARWRQSAVAPAEYTDEQLKHYATLQARVNEYIKQKRGQADTKGNNLFGGKVDLSAAELTDETIQLGAKTFSRPDHSLVEDAIDQIENWFKQARRASADNLMKQLSGYELPPAPNRIATTLPTTRP